MRYRNTRTGAETNQFSDADWKSGQPQRNGWVDTTGEKPLKTTPKEIIDFVFKKKPEAPKEVIEPEKFKQAAHFGDTKGEFEPLPKADNKLKVSIPKQSKTKQNDNPKQKRTAAKRKS